MIASGLLVRNAAGRGWLCKTCNKEDTKSKLARHIQTKHMDVTFYCPYCSHTNRNEEARQDHIRNAHGLKLKCKEIREITDKQDG